VKTAQLAEAAAQPYAQVSASKSPTVPQLPKLEARAPRFPVLKQVTAAAHAGYLGW
jgi:hypothetical protein